MGGALGAALGRGGARVVATTTGRSGRHRGTDRAGWARPCGRPRRGRPAIVGAAVGGPTSARPRRRRGSGGPGATARRPPDPGRPQRGDPGRGVGHRSARPRRADGCRRRVLDRGRVVATAAVHVGGRLQVVDEAGRIVRLDPAGSGHAARAGYAWELGDTATEEELTQVAETMADALVAAVTGDPPPADVLSLYLTDPLVEVGPIDGVMFSGGVAEYVYDRETERFGDLGRPLGRAIRARVDSGALPYPLLPAGECIRATALGASEYSVQLSGNTGCISDPDALLPRRNLQVLRPSYELGDTVDPVTVATAIRRHLVALDAAHADADIALAMSWTGLPSHARLLAFAQGVRDGLAERIALGKPVYVMLDGDVAMTLGRLLRQELGVLTGLLVVDGLALRDFDWIDIGRMRYPSNTVPVTIKSLVFSQSPGV
ncbi:ethanolamine ammonia-lyase reactivating factor EutA [Modestobacter lapidis]